MRIYVHRICVGDFFGGACGNHICRCAVRVYGLYVVGGWLAVPDIAVEAKDVPIQIHAIAVRYERGWFGERSTSDIAPMERMRDRMMILEVVRGEAHTCCHLIEGMV